MQRLFFVPFILLAVLISGCVSQPILTGTPVIQAEDAKRACVNLCKQAKLSQDLSNGPCLSNEVARNWVCDVAHDPRLEVDNNPANQCSAYREGKAQHFVEVDPDCNLIRAV